MTVISADQYAGPTRDTAKRASENLLNRFATRVDGIFTPNESSTAGMLLALQDIGKAGAMTFVGFDYSSSFIEPLRRGEAKGFVVQNPVNMGYLSVKTMVAHLKQQQVPATVDTGVRLGDPGEPAGPEDPGRHQSEVATAQRMLGAEETGGCPPLAVRTIGCCRASRGGARSRHSIFVERLDDASARAGRLVFPGVS